MKEMFAKQFSKIQKFFDIFLIYLKMVKIYIENRSVWTITASIEIDGDGQDGGDFEIPVGHTERWKRHSGSRLQFTCGPSNEYLGHLTINTHNNIYFIYTDLGLKIGDTTWLSPPGISI